MDLMTEKLSLKKQELQIKKMEVEQLIKKQQNTIVEARLTIVKAGMEKRALEKLMNDIRITEKGMKKYESDLALRGELLIKVVEESIEEADKIIGQEVTQEN